MCLCEQATLQLMKILIPPLINQPIRYRPRRSPTSPAPPPERPPNLAAPDQAVPEQDTDTSTIYWPAPEVPGAPASQPDQCADGPGDGAP